MRPNITPLTFTASLTWRQRIVPATRYHWKNDQRGGTRYVIIQQTLSGYGTFEDATGRKNVRPGQAFVALVPEKSSYYYPKGETEPWVLQWCDLDDEHSFRMWGDFRNMFGAVLPLAPASPAGRRFEELLQAIQDQRSVGSFRVSEAAYSFYLAWWQQLQRPKESDRSPLAKAEEFMRANFRRPMSVQDIATEAGISREHLTRAFVERHGISPGLYLRRLRLDAASQLRQSTAQSLAEIAMRCGFQNARQLSKWLRLDR